MQKHSQTIKKLLYSDNKETSLLSVEDNKEVSSLTGIVGMGMRTMQCAGCTPAASQLAQRSKSSHEAHLQRYPSTAWSQPSHTTPQCCGLTPSADVVCNPLALYGRNLLRLASTSQVERSVPDSIRPQTTCVQLTSIQTDVLRQLWPGQPTGRTKCSRNRAFYIRNLVVQSLVLFSASVCKQQYVYVDVSTLIRGTCRINNEVPMFTFYFITCQPIIDSTDTTFPSS